MWKRRGEASFFSRWEAQQQGSSSIEWPHLLLGIIRETNSAANESFKLKDQEPTIRGWLPASRPALADSVDLPLSNECKRVLAYAAEEAERASHKYIHSDHLLLGLLREKGSAQQLETLGLNIAGARATVKTSSLDRAIPPPHCEPVNTPETNQNETLSFIQRYTFMLILLAFVIGLIIGVNLRG